MHYTTLQYATLHDTSPHYTRIRYTTLRYITLHYTTLHWATLDKLYLHYTTLHCATLHYTIRTSLHCTILHCISPHYTMLTKLQHTTLDRLHGTALRLTDYAALYYTDYIVMSRIPHHTYTSLHHTTVHGSTQYCIPVYTCMPLGTALSIERRHIVLCLLQMDPRARYALKMAINAVRQPNHTKHTIPNHNTMSCHAIFYHTILNHIIRWGR